MPHKPPMVGPRIPSRWELVRDVLVFELKLFLDGLRDVLLAPLSLLAACLDLFAVGPHPGRNFYETLSFGRRTEHWINLFGASDTLPRDDESGLDRAVKRLEGLVVDQYRKGGITAAAKEALDRAFDSLQKKQNRE